MRVLGRQTRSKAEKAILTAFAGLLALLWVIPFLWMLSTSFKIEKDVFRFPVEWIPQVWNFENYAKVFAGQYPFHIYYFNSFVVAVFTVLGAAAVSSAAAYAFARIKFPGRDVLFLLYLAGMMIPGQVILIPQFIIFYAIGILDTRLALILPAMFNVFCIFLLRQFYKQIPQELSEAALIDGAGEATTWIRIILPLTKPALVTVVVLVFTWSWKDYMNPLIFITSRALFTIPLGLMQFVEEFGQQYTPMMAASTTALLPMLIIFIFAQRYFVEGIARTGVKG